jgi:hypothetical protein
MDMKGRFRKRVAAERGAVSAVCRLIHVMLSIRKVGHGQRKEATAIHTSEQSKRRV